MGKHISLNLIGIGASGLERDMIHIMMAGISIPIGPATITAQKITFTNRVIPTQQIL